MLFNNSKPIEQILKIEQQRNNYPIFVWKIFFFVSDILLIIFCRKLERFFPIMIERGKEKGKIVFRRIKKLVEIARAFQQTSGSQPKLLCDPFFGTTYQFWIVVEKHTFKENQLCPFHEKGFKQLRFVNTAKPLIH